MYHMISTSAALRDGCLHPIEVTASLAVRNAALRELNAASSRAPRSECLGLRHVFLRRSGTLSTKYQGGQAVTHRGSAVQEGLVVGIQVPAQRSDGVGGRLHVPPFPAQDADDREAKGVGIVGRPARVQRHVEVNLTHRPEDIGALLILGAAEEQSNQRPLDDLAGPGPVASGSEVSPAPARASPSVLSQLASSGYHAPIVSSWMRMTSSRIGTAAAVSPRSRQMVPSMPRACEV